jgi:tRNA(Arg) A34 adenosine deaminase TadA
VTKPDRTVAASCPEWVEQAVDWNARYATDESKMSLAVELARQNVLHGSGGPFGAAVFESASGMVVAAGVNSVTRLQNSMLHAEVLALMLAEYRVGSYTLLGPELPHHALVTTCDPCAMCLGAVLWSGVRRLVTGADRADASALDFDEGPVFPESYAYLEARGVAVVRGVLRREAAAVMELYRRQGGVIYNA